MIVLVLWNGIAVGQAIQRDIDFVLHLEVRAAQDGGVQLAELQVLGLLDDLGPARYKPELNGGRQAVVDGALLADDLVRVADRYLAYEGSIVRAVVSRPAPNAHFTNNKCFGII